MPTETASLTGFSRHRVRLVLRVAGRAVVALVLVAAAWIGVALHPQPLFAYSTQRANLVLHARQPLSPEGDALLDEVVRRLARSPLYDRARVHDVFLCDTPALFSVFALWNRRVGGIAQVHLRGNVFIRPFNLARGRLIGPNGDEKPGERTLAYYIAHEVTHALTADRIGRWRYLHLPAFQVEGYADHVAFAHELDLRAARTAMLAGAPEMSPKQSGLYRRYELLVAYLLRRRGMSVEEMLSRPLVQREVEAEVGADAGL